MTWSEWSQDSAVRLLFQVDFAKLCTLGVEQQANLLSVCVIWMDSMKIAMSGDIIVRV